MRVRLNIDDAFLKEMQQKIGDQATPVDLVREGLTMLRWAIDEAAKGRLVLSTDTTGDELKRLVLPFLSWVEQRSEQSRSPALASA